MGSSVFCLCITCGTLGTSLPSSTYHQTDRQTQTQHQSLAVDALFCFLCGGMTHAPADLSWQCDVCLCCCWGVCVLVGGEGLESCPTPPDCLQQIQHLHTHHTQDSVTGHKVGGDMLVSFIPECVCVFWLWWGPYHWAWLGPQDLTQVPQHTTISQLHMHVACSCTTATCFTLYCVYVCECGCTCEAVEC